MPAPAQDIALNELAGDLARLEAAVEAWANGPRDTARAYREAIDSLHAEALRRLLRMLRRDPAAAAALREAAADDVVLAVLRHHGLVKPTIAERVEAALESVRPMLASHGGNIELVRFEPPAIAVRFIGACDNCPASRLTIDAAVKAAVRASCPEITDIVQVKGTAAGEGASDDLLHLAPGEAPWFPAGMLADIPEGGMRAATVNGRAVIISRSGAAVTCFEDACAHLGAALSTGIADRGVLTCPRHGFRYDLRTGRCETAPDIALAAHEARVMHGRVLVRLAA